MNESSNMNSTESKSESVAQKAPYVLNETGRKNESWLMKASSG